MNNAARRLGNLGGNGLKCMASRHRLHFGNAIVTRGGAPSTAERRGQSLAAFRKEVMLPCEGVAEVRRFNMFTGMLNGDGVLGFMWATTERARIRSRRTNPMSGSLISSGNADGPHKPVRPMAAHQ